MAELRVRGARDQGFAAAAPHASRFGVEPIATYELEATRDAAEEPRTESLPDKHVMELHIELPDAAPGAREFVLYTLARALAEATKQREEARQIWDRLFEADLRLLQWLDHPTGNGNEAQVRDYFLEALRAANGGSPRERATIHEQFDFIHGLLRSPSLASRLQKIRKQLPLPEAG